MEKFNFKVGDKLRLIRWDKDDYIEILLLFGENKAEHLFTAIDMHGRIEGNYTKSADWQLYQEPKQKQKLQKFYCGTTDELIYPEYWKTKEEALKNRKNVYTEAEFLEKFDVEM